MVIPSVALEEKSLSMSICQSTHTSYGAYQLVLRGIPYMCVHLASRDHFMGEGIGYVHFDDK